MIRNILATFGTRVVVSVGNLVLALALARCMGPERQGAVSYLMMLVGLLVLGSGLGLDAAAVYHLNRLGLGARAYLRRVLPVLVPSMAVAALLSLVLFHYRLLGTTDTNQPLLLALMLLIFPLELGVTMVRGLLMARERIVEYNGVEVVQSLAHYALAGLVLWRWPQNIALVLATYLVARVVVAVLVANKLRANPLDAGPPGPPAPPLAEVLRYAIFPWLANVFAMLNIRLDTLMVAWYVGRSPQVSAADLGLYTISTLAVARLQDVQMAIQVAFFPRAASLERRDAAELTGRFYRTSTPLYFVLVVVMAALGWPVLRLFGPDYVRAYATLVTLSFGLMAVRANSGVLSIYFTAQGRPHIPTLVNGAGVVVNALLNVWLIPKYGMLGAALGTVGACFLTKGLLVAAFMREGAGYRKDLLLKSQDVREAWGVVMGLLHTHPKSPWRRDRPQP